MVEHDYISISKDKIPFYFPRCYSYQQTVKCYTLHSSVSTAAPLTDKHMAQCNAPRDVLGVNKSSPRGATTLNNSRNVKLVIVLTGNLS